MGTNLSSSWLRVERIIFGTKQFRRNPGLIAIAANKETTDNDKMDEDDNEAITLSLQETTVSLEDSDPCSYCPHKETQRRHLKNHVKTAHSSETFL